MACNVNSSVLVTDNASSNGDGVSYAGAGLLADFSAIYIHCHGAIALAICIFGVVANVLNIIVLTRKEMWSSTNCLLTALAVSDGCTMMAYTPFALYFYLIHDPEAVNPQRNTIHAARFMLFYAGFSVFTHTVSIWLTVTLAVFRYIFISLSNKGATWRTIERAKLAIGIVTFGSLVICIPNFITVDLSATPAGENGSEVIWEVRFKASACDSNVIDDFVLNFNFWIQAMLVKIVPCLCLTVLSGLLVRSLREADRRRKKLRGGGAGKKMLAGGGAKGGGASDQQANRTTAMLLTVVLMFLATELPQGILNLLSGVLDQNFVSQIYMPLGDAMDILVLLNSSVNFIIYCVMSLQFRNTFTALFCPYSSKVARTPSTASL